MERKDVDENSTKKRASKRKEIVEKKKVVDGLIKAASAVKDPLDSFPEFRRRNLQGLCFHLEAGLGTKLSRILKQYIKKLLEVNMKRHYGMEWPTEEKVKYREINAPEARYIFVYKALSSGSCEPDRFMSNEKGDIVGFVHYRFILEEDLPVLYLYELQLEPEIQGKGLGRLLMQLLELIAQKSDMSAIVLTVQKTNLSAMSFYTSKLGYSIAAASPSRVEPLRGVEINYEILCKAFDQEAKSILEAPSPSQSSGRQVLESSEEDSMSLQDDADDVKYDLESDQFEKSQDRVQDEPVEKEALVSSSSDPLVYVCEFFGKTIDELRLPLRSGEVDDRYEEWYRLVSHPLIIDPEFVGAPIGDGTDVTAETAHTLLDRLAQGETIADEREQARYFRSMLHDFLPLLPGKDANSRAGDDSPKPSSRGGRSRGRGRAGDGSGGDNGTHGSCDTEMDSFTRENFD
ncbi:hypothetical protein KSS87_023439 [Heliosperma pusillum]|nr:hypothetical protein KSS87_023439 [Heliosperma pusillum]